MEKKGEEKISLPEKRVVTFFSWLAKLPLVENPFWVSVWHWEDHTAPLSSPYTSSHLTSLHLRADPHRKFNSPEFPLCFEVDFKVREKTSVIRCTLKDPVSLPPARFNCVMNSTQPPASDFPCETHY